MAEFAHVSRLEAGQSNESLVQYGKVRKYTLLMLFCVSQFLDAFK